MIRNDLDSSNRSNKNLQVLRGLSALLVLLFHINPSLFRFGYIGVDIFFYISGFLLIPRVIELTQKRNFKVGFFDFLSRRFRRLLPPLYVLLLIFNPLIFLLGFPSQHLDVLSLWALPAYLGLPTMGHTFSLETILNHESTPMYIFGRCQLKSNVIYSLQLR